MMLTANTCHAMPCRAMPCHACTHLCNVDQIEQLAKEAVAPVESPQGHCTTKARRCAAQCTCCQACINLGLCSAGAQQLGITLALRGSNSRKLAAGTSCGEQQHTAQRDVRQSTIVLCASYSRSRIARHVRYQRKRSAGGVPTYLSSMKRYQKVLKSVHRFSAPVWE